MNSTEKEYVQHLEETLLFLLNRMETLVRTYKNVLDTRIVVCDKCHGDRKDGDFDRDEWSKSVYGERN